MKITGYTQQITNVGGSGGTPRVDNSAAIQAVKENGAMAAKVAQSGALDYTPIAKGLDSWTSTINQIHEQQDRQNVLAAMDDYNQKMNELLNGKNGYLTRELQGADGIAEDYVQKEKQIRAQTLGNARLHFAGNKAGLEHSLASNAQQSFNRVAQWQTKQMDAVSDLHLENVITNNIENAQADYSNPDAVKNARLNIVNALSLRHNGKGADYLEAVTRKTLGRFGASLMDAANGRNDFAAAANIYQEYKPFLSPEQRNKYEQQSVNLQLGEQQRALFDEWLKAGVPVDEAMRRIDAMDSITVKNINARNIPEQAEGTTWKRMSSTKTSLDGLFPKTRKGLDVAAIIYSEMFPGEKLLLTSGTDGKHDTHKGESIDVNDDFGKTILADKANRDKFKAALAAQGIRVLDEYEVKTKNQTGPHLHLEFNDFNPGSGEVKIPMTLKQKQEYKNMYIAALNQQKHIKALEDKDFFNSIRDQAVELAKQKVPLAQALQQLAFTQTGENFVSAKNAVGAAYSGLNLGGAGGGSENSEYGKGSHPVLLTGLKTMIGVGKFASKSDVYDYAKGRLNLSESDVNKAMTAYDQYLEGTGEFAYHWDDIKQRVMQGERTNTAVGEQAWAEARAYGSDFIRRYMMEHNGQIPRDSDVIKACIEGKTRNFELNYTKPTAIFGSTHKYSKGAMQMAKIVDIKPSPNNKNKSIVYYKGDNGRLIGKEVDNFELVGQLGGVQ